MSSPPHTGFQEANTDAANVRIAILPQLNEMKPSGFKGKSTSAAGQLFLRGLNRLVAKWGIGLAVFDEHLRYRMVNPWLAARDGLDVRLHTGKQPTDVIGKAGTSLEAALKATLISRRPILNFETEGTLPIKREGKHWVASFFPATDAQGNVREIAAIFVEIRNAEPEHAFDIPNSRNLELLRSWKDIASYMGTCVKTVQRWEHVHNLPVRRVTSSKGAMVFALRSEMDSWMRSHRTTKSSKDPKF